MEINSKRNPAEAIGVDVGCRRNGLRGSGISGLCVEFLATCSVGKAHDSRSAHRHNVMYVEVAIQKSELLLRRRAVEANELPRTFQLLLEEICNEALC